MVADLLSPNRCHWYTKVKNYNLNVTEVLDSTLIKSFPGIFNFTVGILTPEHLPIFEFAVMTIEKLLSCHLLRASPVRKAFDWSRELSGFVSHKTRQNSASSILRNDSAFPVSIRCFRA